MALDLTLLKQPKVLIIGGVAVVGGLFIASKSFGGKSSANTTPAQPSVSQTVVRDPTRDSGNSSPGNTPAAPPVAPVATPAPRIDKNVSSPAPSSKALPPKQAPIQMPVLPPGGRAPIILPPGAAPRIQPPRTTPAPHPAPVAVYPGLGSGFAMNCATSYRGRLGTFETLKAEYQKGRDKSGEGLFLARNLMAASVFGVGGPWLGLGDWSNPGSINKRRVANGLYPLTAEEIQQMLAQINEMSAAGNLNSERNARILHARWSYPYQCGVRTR